MQNFTFSRYGLFRNYQFWKILILSIGLFFLVGINNFGKIYFKSVQSWETSFLRKLFLFLRKKCFKLIFPLKYFSLLKNIPILNVLDFYISLKNQLYDCSILMKIFWIFSRSWCSLRFYFPDFYNSSLQWGLLMQ